MSKKEAVYGAYQQWSAIYESQVNPTRDLSAALVRHLAPPLAGKVVVEAGCGTGFNTGWLVAQGAVVTGFDFSDGMLAIARTKTGLEGVKLLQHDIVQPWPVRENSAEFVLINLVLEHIEDIDTVISHALTSMKAGATLLITEYHPDRVAQGKGAEFANEETGLTEIINFWHPPEKYRAIATSYNCQDVTIRNWAELTDVDAAPDESNDHPLVMTIQMTK